MKKTYFTHVFPYALIFAMGWFLYNQDNLQAWICISLGTLLWLIQMGNDIRNGNNN